ncbi:MAG: hypothetical protein DRP27_02480 [Thermotogae bacterium]|nr:MAG: hypothetical protein DRP27_02480 [Thermotogota bacterium]
MATIFLDFDGTLVDVMPRFHAIFSDYLVMKGFSPPTLSEYRRLKRLHNYDPEIFKALNIDVAWEDYGEWKVNRVESTSYLCLDKLIGEPHYVVERLRDRGYSVVLLSARRIRENLLTELEWLKISGLFDDVLVTEDYKIDSKARKLAKIAENGDIIVGDSETELTAAKELGIRHFGVTTGLRSVEFLFENGARVVLCDYTALLDVLT